MSDNLHCELANNIKLISFYSLMLTVQRETFTKGKVDEFDESE